MTIVERDLTQALVSLSSPSWTTTVERGDEPGAIGADFAGTSAGYLHIGEESAARAAASPCRRRREAPPRKSIRARGSARRSTPSAVPERVSRPAQVDDLLRSPSSRSAGELSSAAGAALYPQSVSETLCRLRYASRNMPWSATDHVGPRAKAARKHRRSAGPSRPMRQAPSVGGPRPAEAVDHVRDFLGRPGRDAWPAE